MGFEGVDLELPPPPTPDLHEEPTPRLSERSKPKCSEYEYWDYLWLNKRPKKDPKLVNSYRAFVPPPTQEDVEKLLKVALEGYGTLYAKWNTDILTKRKFAKLWQLRIYIMAKTGFRISECLALQVKDFDLEKGQIIVSKAMTPSGKPKVGSFGIQGIGPKAIAYYREAFKILKIADKSDYYVMSARPKPMTADPIERGLKQIVVAANMNPKNIFPHIFRVFVGTRYYDQYGPKFAAEVLRHKDSSGLTLLKHYVRHTSEETLKLQAKASDDLMPDL